MTMKTEFAAQWLRTGSEGLAGLATAKLFEQNPESLTDDFLAWKGHMRGKVLQLAAAIQTNSPAAFAGHVLWIRQAFEARAIPPEVVGAALDSLAEVIAESVPSDATAILAPHWQAAQEALASPQSSPQCFLNGDHPDGKLALAYMAALRNGDAKLGYAMVMQALEEGPMQTAEILDRVLTPALQEMGQLWHKGEASVAEEHFTTRATEHLIAQLVTAAPPMPYNGKTALVSGVAGNAHSLGVQVVAAHLELAGWRTICLGTNMPPADLALAAQTFGAHVVLLGATLGFQLEALSEVIAMIRTTAPEAKVLVGGSAFAHCETAWKEMGAHGFADNASQAVEMASRLT